MIANDFFVCYGLRKSFCYVCDCLFCSDLEGMMVLCQNFIQIKFIGVLLFSCDQWLLKKTTVLLNKITKWKKIMTTKNFLVKKSVRGTQGDQNGIEKNFEKFRQVPPATRFFLSAPRSFFLVKTSIRSIVAPSILWRHMWPTA